MQYDDAILSGFSDHVLVMTQLQTPPIPGNQYQTVNGGGPKIIYKWVEGTNSQNYMDSANTWRTFTEKEEFRDKFRAVVQDP